MYCIRVGRYWLGWDKCDYLSPSILSVEKYVLTDQEETATLRLKTWKEAEAVLEDYRMMIPHSWGARIVYKADLPFE